MSKIVEPYLKKLDYLKDKLEDIGQRAVKENVDLIIYTLQEKQLSKGLDSSGSIVGTYSKYTALLASDPHNKPREPKIPGQKYNMDWTGELFETMSVRAERDSYSIFSTTGKDDYLRRNTSFGEIMKLTQDNNQWINEEIILPYIQKFILDNFLLV